jgi:uncharacterized membrane protein
MLKIEDEFPMLGPIVGPKLANIIGLLCGIGIVMTLAQNWDSLVWVICFVYVIVTIVNSTAVFLAKRFAPKNE